MLHWNDGDIELLRSLVECGEYDWAEIARRVGRSVEACRGKWKRERSSLTTDDEGNEGAEDRSILDSWHAERREVTWEELIEYMNTGAELHQSLRPLCTSAQRTIRSGRDVYLAFISDLHFGSPYCNYAKFFEITKILKDHDIYFVIVGKDLETAFAWFKAADAVLNQVAPPWMQIEAFRMWLKYMFDHAICICGDNHTDRRLRGVLGDVDISWAEGIPYFAEWGILTLNINSVEYSLCLAHQWRGSSVYHSLQPTLRLMGKISPLCDVYATAHTHGRPAYLCSHFWPTETRIEPQHLIVCGSIQGGDAYSLRFGGGGIPAFPVLRLGSQQHEISYFYNIESAGNYLGDR